MKHKTWSASASWSTSTSMIRVLGLIVLGGLFFAVRPVPAQIECPLPAGVMPPADPRVTAQQVENGSATLMDFALAVRDHNSEISRLESSSELLAYLGCRSRQEGSPYRSGSTYLVLLTPAGRISVHTQNMALSGRQLNPSIYGAILEAVGIDPGRLADPAAAVAAFTAAAAGNGGAVDLPEIPGASGYAFAYLSPSFRIPLLMLAGFNLNESHMAQEDIDYGNPAVAARDVVDRETLKAFVREAGDYFVALQESGDLAATAKARIALRDPNGPWRHGSVYLYILYTEANVILFHGAFPDRFELRPLTPTIRDVVTGEFILPKVIDAAKSNPEGGYVEYYFDDPSDATDSADIPKVGYARVFTGTLQRPDGSVVPLSYIIGSGFSASGF